MLNCCSRRGHAGSPEGPALIEEAAVNRLTLLAAASIASLVLSSNPEARGELFQLGSSFLVTGTNFPTNFGPATVTLGQSTTVNNGQLTLSETFVPDGPNAEWAVFNFSTTSGGPLAGNSSGLWQVNLNNIPLTQVVNYDNAFIYWTANGSAFSPLSLWGNVTQIAPNPINPSLGPAFFLPAGGTLTSLNVFANVFPYSFLNDVGVNTSAANDFHFGVHVTAVPEPSAWVLLAIAVGMVGVTRVMRRCRRLTLASA
jgi:hypothetical protein